MVHDNFENLRDFHIFHTQHYFLAMIFVQSCPIICTDTFHCAILSMGTLWNNSGHSLTAEPYSVMIISNECYIVMYF